MTVFDRYLLRRYFHVFFIFLVSTFGLFVVIDGFTNVDGFQEGKTSAVDVLARMAEYYSYQASQFFDMIAPFLSAIAVMVTCAMLYKNGELYPVLAAGVPTYRLVVPLVVGVAMIAGILAVNRELVIPRIAHHLRSPRNERKPQSDDVQPIYDHRTRILIGGATLVRGTPRMKQARFILPQGIAEDLTPLRAPRATFHRRRGNRPAGWELKKPRPRYDELRLTEQGAKVVHAIDAGDRLFVETDVSYDQLSNRGQSFRYASTTELTRRVRNPSYGNSSVRSLALAVHSRLAEPLLGLVLAFATVPLVIRRESRGLVSNIVVWTLVMGLLFALLQGGLYLGKVSLLGPSLAVFGPLILMGTLAAWLADLVQT